MKDHVNSVEANKALNALSQAVAKTDVIQATNMLEEYGVTLKVNYPGEHGWSCSVVDRRGVVAEFHEDGHAKSKLANWQSAALCAVVAASLLDDARQWEMEQLWTQQQEDEDNDRWD